MVKYNHRAAALLVYLYKLDRPPCMYIFMQSDKAYYSFLIINEYIINYSAISVSCILYTKYKINEY